jgi:DNA polymerase-3 subunit beta
VKFSISKEQFLEGLQRVQNVVSTRTTLPILSNVHLQASKNALQLTTTDLDVGIRAEISTEIQKTGATTLPARRLFAIVRDLPAEKMDVEVDDRNTASIKSGNAFFRIVGLAVEEFPPLPKLSGGKAYKMEQKTLKEMLQKTAYAISNDETRYVLNGIFMSFKADKLTVVATDGRRLALIERDLDVGKGNETEAILPTKAVNELQRLLADKGDVQITIAENQAAFQLDSTLLVSKLIEGTYPNYRQVIPTECKERVPLEREQFLAALHRASLLATEKTNSVKLQFSKNQLTISANTPEVGEAKETLAINYKGKDFAIAFNPQFLMDPLRNLDADEVYLELIDELSPGVVKVKEPFLYVLMPMRMS